jgi:rfaE bifunctional protein kinase chain/domain
MSAPRLRTVTSRYATLKVAVVGDFCLDRYLEIDPRKKETSLETGLAVHNVTRVRSQPGGAGTILNNLVALGVGAIWPIGFCGEDGEGWELQRALKALAGVSLKYFFPTNERRTFTYTKPLIISKGKAPRELNRLDSKNWSPTPKAVSERIAASVRSLAGKVDAIIVLDQTDVPQTGVATTSVLKAIGALAKRKPKLVIIADSRQGLRNFPPVAFKLNAKELAAHIGNKRSLTFAQIKSVAAKLAKKQSRPIFVTLAERGIVGATPSGAVEHIAALPIHGEIDIVGAGDAVTANLAAALAAGATIPEALALANAAASVVIHKLGTTGTASIKEIAKTLTQGRKGAKAQRIT